MTSASTPALEQRVTAGFLRLPYVVRLGVFGALYFGLVAATCSVGESSGLVRSVWPASGLALASLLLTARSRWLGLLSAMFVATFASRLMDDKTVGLALLLAIPNVVEALAGALLLNRFAGRVSFRRVKDVLLLGGFAVVGCGAIGLMAAAIARLGGDQDLIGYWRMWWSADGLGVLLVTPFVIAWLRSDPPPSWRRLRFSETAVFAAAWGLALWFVFGMAQTGLIAGPRPYVIFPLLAWASMRLGMRGATLALTILTVVAIAATATFEASALQVPIANDPLLLVQVFVGTATLATILLAASLSERRAAEAALSDREYRNRMLLAGLPVAVYTTDTNGYLSSYNQAAADLWGRLPVMQRERWCGSTQLLTASGERLPHERSAAARALEHDTAVRGEEAQIERVDGTRVPFIAYATPLRNTSGELTGVMNVLVDITERKRAESATLGANVRYARQASALNALTRLSVTDDESLARALRQLVETVADTLKVERVGVWRFNKNGSLLACHELFERTPRRHSSGQELSRHEHPIYFETIARADVIAANDAAADARTSEFRNAYLPQHGITSMLDTPIRLAGACVGVLCCEHVGPPRAWTPDEQAFAIGVANLLTTLVEQSQRWHLENQLRQSQKLEAIGQLAGGVAHDFNNLLTVIMGNGVALQLDDRLPEDARSVAAEIVLSSERASNLTRQLLAFSRRQAMQPRLVDLNQAVASLARMLHRLLGSHVKMDCVYAAGEIQVNADPNMLDQVLVNLAVNARDAMPDGGQLTVETSLVTVDRIEDDGADARPGTFACLRVRDTGTGIAPEHLSRIFEPFFTTKEAGRGTGLGLATTYGIVRQHEGWISVDSAPGEGTTFKVFLPLADAEADSEDISVQDDVALSGSETILVVEDDEPLRTMIRSHLTNSGYKVLDAEDGEQAQRIFDEYAGTIDLLLTDLVLPGSLNGVVLGRQLQRTRPMLRVLYTSGYHGELAGAGFLLKGQPNFLPKPFTMPALALAVRRCLARDDRGLD